ncbi:MAG: hypothetical protein U9R72_02880 [Chloroflexota bacterium]|nr:hypothetical protein [Chloroflexota bacterium]
MLSGRARIVLFWVTIATMVVVAVLAGMTILRACGSPTPEESPPTISPAEISLCPGEKHQFTIVEGIDVTWEATGGRITEEGLFIAAVREGAFQLGGRQLELAPRMSQGRP